MRREVSFPLVFVVQEGLSIISMVYHTFSHEVVVKEDLHACGIYSYKVVNVFVVVH